MPTIIISIISFVVSGLIFRLLASVGLAIATANFVRDMTDDYLNKALTLMNTSTSADVVSLLGIVGVDKCLSVIFGGLSFIATYKSLRFVFVRK